MARTRVGCIAVTGLEGMDNPSPGVAVARSLREAAVGGQIVGLTYNALNTGVFAEDLFDAVWIVPAPSEPAEALYGRLREIAATTPIDVLVPTLDTEIAVYARLRRRLEALGIRTLVPSEEGVKKRNKIALPLLCRQAGVDYPETFVVTASKHLDHYLGEGSFPWVLKGSVADAHVAHSGEEAHAFFARLADTWGLPVLLQRFVEGDECDVAGLASPDSELVGAVAMRKMAITPKGKAASGVTIQDDELIGLVERIVRHLRWVGPLEVEFIKERGTGRRYLFEINARFPAWIYLATGAGQNLPAAAVRLAMGEQVPKFEPSRPGVLFARNMREHLCSIAHFGQLAAIGETHFHVNA